MLMLLENLLIIMLMIRGITKQFEMMKKFHFGILDFVCPYDKFRNLLHEILLFGWILFKKVNMKTQIKYLKNS